MRNVFTAIVVLCSTLSFASQASLQSYDAGNLNPNPAAQGWTADRSLSGTGSVDTSTGEPLYLVDGTSGRSEWRIVPNAAVHSAASSFGWHYMAEMRLLEGGYFTNYYANGAKRYLPIVSLSNGRLEVTLVGHAQTTPFVIATGANATAFHRYEIVTLPNSSGMASFYVDGQLIAKDWPGTSTTQNFVTWGNGSSGVSGKALYRDVRFEVHGDAVFASPDRIPSVISTKDNSGVVAIFAEQRIGGGDPGSASNTNNIITRVSTDFGLTWSVSSNISAPANTNNGFDFSDPRPVLDEVNQRLIVTYAKWPTNAAQNGDVIKPWLDNALVLNEFDLVSKTWSLPTQLPTTSVKEQGLQIVGLAGSHIFSRASNLIPTDSWQLTANLRIAGGGANIVSASNGSKLFQATFARTATDNLVVQLNGLANTYSLKTANDRPFAFFDIEIVFNPASQAATLKVDGLTIATWNGQSATSSLVSFGNNDAAIDGRMHIANIELVKNSSLAFKFDAAALTGLNPATNQTTPESQGWTKTSQGSGFTQYGDSSINPGPGHGIALNRQTFSQGEHNGRLIYPAIQLDKSFLNVVSIYSDDNGQQWQYGDELPLPYQWSGTTLKTLEPSEADIVELLDGRLLMTVRLDFNQIVNSVNYGPRYQFVSQNGGETWSMLTGNGANAFPNISTGTVDASITRIEQTNGTSYLAFTNPIGDLTTHAGRTNLGLWLSFDEGQTWKGPLQLVSGGSAYSDIIQINDSQALVIFEDNTSQIRTMRLPIHLLRQLL